jgi:MraZ protein
MLIPWDLRRWINPDTDGTALYLSEATDNGVPWLYPDKLFRQLASQESSELMPDEDALALDEWLFGTATFLEFDKQGRILIPEKTRKRLNLESEVTLVGARDHIEVWSRSRWPERLANLPQLAAKAKANRKRMREMAAGVGQRPTTAQA